jgi:two-component system cell cycle sensor histidine kinase PleC
LIFAYAASSRRQLMQREEMAHALLVAKEQADAANQSKTRFLAHMSHELRTPLNTILGFAELMETTEAHDPARIQRYKEYCHDIRASGEHLLHLIDDLLDLSKIEANRKNLNLEMTDLSTEIRRSVDMLSSQAASAKLIVEVDLPVDLPSLRVDRRSFRQVMLNLLSNAVKFSLSGGRIFVSAEFDESEVRLIVADTGIGIPQDRITLLGRPFETLDDPLLHKPKGTGLGLALSTALVQLHGGTMAISSDIGVGTRIMVTLPRSLD